MRVAIIADVHGWAFDHIIRGIKKYNPDPTLEIDVIFEEEHRNLPLGQRCASLAKYDVLYPFCLFQAAYLQRMGVDDYIVTVHMAPADCGASPGEHPRFENYWPHLRAAGERAARMSTICPLLMQLWSEHREVSRVVVGVDPEVFYPPWNPPGVLLDKDMAARGRTVNLAQDRQGAHRVLRVGWVGNPDKPYKKYELIREAVDGLPGIEFEPVLWSQGRGDIPKSHLEMAEYYRSLDVYVCLSDHEGLPTPATECSLCGVPVISVPVGVIPELVVDGETGFVVDQSSKALREKLAWMVEHPAETARMGEAMAVRAQYQAWPRAVKEWIAFIKNEPMTAEESPDADEA